MDVAACRAEEYCVVVWRRTLTMSKGWPVEETTGQLVPIDMCYASIRKREHTDQDLGDTSRRTGEEVLGRLQRTALWLLELLGHGDDPRECEQETRTR
jgi:hypothetical protein